MTCERGAFHGAHSRGKRPITSRITVDREPTSLSSPSPSHHRDPVTNGQRPGLGWTRSRNRPSTPEQSGGNRQELPRVAGAAHDDGVEPSFKSEERREGKSVRSCVDLGGRRIIKKKNKKKRREGRGVGRWLVGSDRKTRW